MSTVTTDPEFEQLLEFVRESRGLDFSGYKRPSLIRRTTKRMQDVGCTSYAEYLDLLQVDADEFVGLLDTLLINVTSFFRDREAWEALADKVVPRLIEEKEASRPIRLWSAGCASGEEAYSAAIVLAEALGNRGYRSRVKVYGTDIDEEALRQARLGEYPAKALEAVPDRYRDRYFERHGGSCALRKDLRRCVIYGRHNLVNDVPISRIDLLLCRNTLMYFNSELQSRALANFQYALAPAGYLFLGKSEVMLTRTDRFQPIDLKRRLFQLVDPSERIERQLGAPLRRAQGELERAALESLHAEGFESADVPQLVLDRTRRLVLVNERARQLFRLTSADRGRPLQDLELSYRPLELRSRIDQAETERRRIVAREVEWRRGDVPAFVDIVVTPLQANSGEMIGTSVTFADVTRFRRLEDELRLSRREVETAYEELQSTVEELETTNEELQSTNEELETTNEELQSTNEELETMNEELQSTNEELETMNDELRQRSSDLNDLNFYFETILASVRSCVIVADRELAITVWNSEAQQLFGLRSDEAQGRHLLNLDIGLPLELLADPIRRCLQEGSPEERLTVDATTRFGAQAHLAVTCAPLARDGSVQGVVLLIEEEPAG